MNHVSIPGCWYLDSLPGGEFAGIIPTQHVVQTHRGTVSYPPDEPLWLAITNKPALRFMGQGHEGTGTWEWTFGGEWERRPAACGVWPLIYGLNGERHIAKCEPPTGSQGWRYVAPDGRLVTGDSTIAQRRGLNESTDLSAAQDGSVLVGQGHNGEGACVWGANRLRLLHAGACFNIRGKWDQTTDVVSVSFYTVAWDGIEGHVYWMSMAELLALPLVVEPLPIVTFHFNHPVLIAPFKDPEGVSGAPAEILVNSNNQTALRPCFVAEDTLHARWRAELLGVYSEAKNPAAVLEIAKRWGTRLLLCHDSIAPWTLPPGLRPFDIPAIEIYWYVNLETLAEAVTRWWRDVWNAVMTWPGDICLVPQLYCMGGAPPNELATVAQVMQTLTYLSDLVNSSARIKVLAPFAFQRANGIEAHPVLRAAFVAMLKASPRLPTLIPVEAEPEEPPDTEPVKPKPEPKPVDPRGALMEAVRIMPNEIYALIGPGGYYARVDPTSAGKGLFNGHAVTFDATSIGAHERFELVPQADDPFGRVEVKAIEAGVSLGGDATRYSENPCKQFYTTGGDVTEVQGNELFRVRRTEPGGPVVIFIEHENHNGERFTGLPLTLVPAA